MFSNGICKINANSHPLRKFVEVISINLTDDKLESSVNFSSKNCFTPQIPSTAL